MGQFLAEVITETLDIEAEDKEKAEKKYVLWHEDGICFDCDDEIIGCGCITYHSTEVYHEMSRVDG